MMTEEEARKKWCPMVRYAVAAHGEPFSNMPNERAQTCAASLCMAWRWSQTQRKEFVQGHSAPQIVEIGISHEHGHCGLAGKP